MSESQDLSGARAHLAKAESMFATEDGLFHLQEGLTLLRCVIEGCTTAPDLERMFAVIRAFDDSCFDLPPAARALKIEVVKRLLDFYCEGYGPAEEQRAYEQLLEVARVGS